MKKTCSLISAVIALVIILSAIPFAAFASSAALGEARDGVYTFERYSFPSTRNGEAKITVAFRDGFFTESAYNYNHELAIASLVAALSSENEGPNGDSFVRAFLSGIGCENALTYTHKFGICRDKNDDCAFAFGIKSIPGSDDFLLTAIMRGVGYGTEWVSNLRMYDQAYKGYAAGFRRTAEVAYNSLNDYIDSLASYGVTRDNLKVWITGYSRGAAVANNLGQMVSADGEFDPENVFVYSFATPATVHESKKGDYKNIFSICSELDIVPRLPLAEWGYTRFGTTLYLPCASKSGGNYASLLAGMQREFDGIMESIGRGGEYHNLPYAEQEKAIDLFFAFMNEAISSPEQYKNDGWQDILTNLLYVYESSGDDEEIADLILDALVPNAELLPDVKSFFEKVKDRNLLENIAAATAITAKINIKKAKATTKRDAEILGALADMIKGYRVCLLTERLTGGQEKSTSYYYTLVTAIADIISEGTESPLLIQHWPETYLAWMKSAAPEKLFTTAPHKITPITRPQLIGDVNDDGDVNQADVTALNKYVLTPKKVTINKAVADVDGNGRINISDVLKLQAIVVITK